jgi:hypothetical protein
MHILMEMMNSVIVPEGGRSVLYQFERMKSTDPPAKPEDDRKTTAKNSGK